MLGHLDCDTGRRGGLSDTTLASNEDPPERFLLDQVLQSWSKLHVLGCFDHFRD